METEHKLNTGLYRRVTDETFPGHGTRYGSLGMSLEISGKDISDSCFFYLLQKWVLIKDDLQF
jgi:hypothetical protein